MKKMLDEAQQQAWTVSAKHRFTLKAKNGYKGIDELVIPVLEVIRLHDSPLIPIWSCQGHRVPRSRFYIIFLETKESKVILDDIYDDLLDDGFITNRLTIEKTCLSMVNEEDLFYKVLSLEFIYINSEELAKYIEALKNSIINRKWE